VVNSARLIFICLDFQSQITVREKKLNTSNACQFGRMQALEVVLKLSDLPQAEGLALMAYLSPHKSNVCHYPCKISSAP
jgi:hypothetical protein